MRSELARARSRSKVMTALAVSLGTILVIIAGVGYVVYTKISAAKENFEEVFRAMPMPQGGAEQQSRMLAGQGVYTSTSLPVSSLGLFSGGGLPSQMPSNMNPEDVARVSQTVNKYLERPVMKEFIAELKTDPAIADALAKTKGGNPAALFVTLQNAKGIEKMMAKYVARPDFMKTLLDMSSDPALKGMAGGMGAAMPGMPQQGQGAMPTVSVPQGQAQPGDEDGDGEMTFDPSAISGTPPATQPQQQTASPKTKRVPSPR